MNGASCHEHLAVSYEIVEIDTFAQCISEGALRVHAWILLGAK